MVTNAQERTIATGGEAAKVNGGQTFQRRCGTNRSPRVNDDPGQE
jgi:hypothetical protein